MMSASTCRAAEKSARELHETKLRAVKFYKENGIPEKLEDILNTLFFENPADVYGRLSEYFEHLSKKAIISKVDSREVFDSKGQPTVQTDIYCIVKGTEKYFATSTVASYNNLIDNAPQEKKELDDKERQDNVNAALTLIQAHLTVALINADPCEQDVIDNKILEIANRLKQEQDDEKQREEQEKAAALEADSSSSALGMPTLKEAGIKSTSPKGRRKLGSAKSGIMIPEEPKEELLMGCQAVCCLSQTAVLTGAAVKMCQPFEHIASLNCEKIPDSFELPLPAFNIVNSGKAAPGKQNLLKEVLIIPKPGVPLKKAAKQVGYIYNQIGKMMAAKTASGPAYVNDMGGYCPTVDRPEQLLDTVQEAIQNVGLTPGQDMYFALNCAAHEWFDLEKAKYEMTTGLMKNCDDMIDFYAELLNRYPAIIALIDPLRKHDIDGWAKLCERLSDKCYIIGEHVYPRPERLAQEGFGELRSSGVVLKLQRLTTVTDFTHAAQVTKDDNAVVMVSDVVGAASEPLLADMAVAVGAKFVKFGAPSRGERVAQYNRLIQISEMLEQQGKLCPIESFNFPILKAPTPEPTDDNGGGGGDDIAVDKVAKKKK